MGNYRVVFPVGFMNSKGESMTCTTVGTVVDVDDEQAVQLVVEGKLEPVHDVEEPKPDARASRAKTKAE